MEKELSTVDKRRTVSVNLYIPKLEIEYKLIGNFNQDSLNAASYLGFRITGDSNVIIRESGSNFFNVINKLREKYDEWKTMVLKDKL